MIVKLARFEVRKDAVDAAVAAIKTFVDEVTRKEGGTASYKSFQEKADPTRFTHHMAFRTPSAESYHQGTPWAKAFTAKLHPLCVEPPTLVEVVEIA